MLWAKISIDPMKPTVLSSTAALKISAVIQPERRFKRFVRVEKRERNGFFII
jgi:hypothetical protein